MAGDRRTGAFAALAIGVATSRPLGASPFLSVVSLTVAACDAPIPLEERESQVRERVAQEEAREWAEVQRIWRLKERQGQGCEGEILRGEELRNAVVGKRHTLLVAGLTLDPRHPLTERRNFKSDGTLPSSFFEAEYEIDGALVCTRVLRPQSPIESCYRLIRSPEGKFFEERLVASGMSSDRARDQDLSCIELDIAEIGANE